MNTHKIQISCEKTKVHPKCQKIPSVAYSEHEKQFLEEIASAFNLEKRQGNPIPYAKALQLLLSHCIHNQISPAKHKTQDLEALRKMVEQIHASIPHLLYQNNLQSMVLTSPLNDGELKLLKEKNLAYLNDHFAGFQNITYNKINIKINGIGL